MAAISDYIFENKSDNTTSIRSVRLWHYRCTPTSRTSTINVHLQRSKTIHESHDSLHLRVIGFNSANDEARFFRLVTTSGSADEAASTSEQSGIKTAITSLKKIN